MSLWLAPLAEHSFVDRFRFETRAVGPKSRDKVGGKCCFNIAPSVLDGGHLKIERFYRYVATCYEGLAGCIVIGVEPPQCNARDLKLLNDAQPSRRKAPVQRDTPAQPL